ncbi:MAG: hypothetical protein M3Q75_05710, partial [Gemmatimonadota bacterium]|nr:hypothetical protein [Gemmatimonadota bacterium]
MFGEDVKRSGRALVGHGSRLIATVSLDDTGTQALLDQCTLEGIDHFAEHFDERDQRAWFAGHQPGVPGQLDHRGDIPQDLS